MEPLYLQLNKYLYKLSDPVVKTETNPEGSIFTAIGYIGSDLSNSGNLLDPNNLKSGSVVGNLEFTGGYIQSANYVSGSTGWRLSADGIIRATGAIISGTINASTINIPDTTTANSFHVDVDGNTWWGATIFGAAIASVSKAGAAIFTSIKITGVAAGSSIDGQYLTNLSVATAAIAAAAVTTAKIAANAVTAAEIATGAVGSTELAAGSVVAGKIAALTIVAADIAAGTITGAKIAAVTITAANIAALTITAAEIAANTITAAKITANTITATELSTSITYAGSIVIDTAGLIRSGQTAFDTGTGWFIGNVSGTSKLSIGVGGSTTNSLTWDGINLRAPGFMNLITTGTFNSTSTNATFTAAVTDIITSVAHGLKDGDTMELTTTGTLPAGLSITTPYFVRDKTTDTFKLSLDPFGAVVDITDTGTGTHTWTNKSGSMIVPFTAYTNLKIVIVVPSSTSAGYIAMNFNTDGGTNYGVSSVTDGAAVVNNANARQIINLSGSTSDTNYKYVVCTILNTATVKKVGTFIGYDAGTGAGVGASTATGGFVWNNTTDQITQINVQFAPTARAGFGAGSIVYVYGVN